MSKKPDKPRPDFPLFAHHNGQWSKKICGRFCYFGVWGDPQAALEKYQKERDYLYTGQQPPTGDVSQAVIDSIMGWTRQDMASIYRQKVFNIQLKTCTNHVRLWYLGKVNLDTF